MQTYQLIRFRRVEAPPNRNVPARFDISARRIKRIDNHNVWIRLLAVQLSEWKRNNQFCGVCGKNMKMHETERAMFCECNSALVYPKISPCIIVLVTKGEELLLAHNNVVKEKF